MATDRLLINYLPHYEQQYAEIEEIMKAEQPEIDDLWTTLEKNFADQYILDATEYGVMRWESMLQISPKNTDTLDERKFRILARLNQELPYTLTKLKEVLTNLCGADGFFIELKAAQYHIEIRLAVGNHNNYQEVMNLLKKMIPANLTQNVSLMYNQHITVAQHTHQHLSAFTHNQVRNEVLG